MEEYSYQTKKNRLLKQNAMQPSIFAPRYTTCYFTQVSTSNTYIRSAQCSIQWNTGAILTVAGREPADYLVHASFSLWLVVHAQPLLRPQFKYLQNPKPSLPQTSKSSKHIHKPNNRIITRSSQNRATPLSLPPNHIHWDHGRYLRVGEIDLCRRIHLGLPGPDEAEARASGGGVDAESGGSSVGRRRKRRRRRRRGTIPATPLRQDRRGLTVWGPCAKVGARVLGGGRRRVAAWRTAVCDFFFIFCSFKNNI
jgi:hypothetical protein